MTIHKPFTFIELFAGVGGFRQGMEQVGMECVFSSEIDEFANKSYKALYGHATEGDIYQVDAEDVPVHDIIAGGFPCQAFSLAGHRGGFEDARGTLFFEILRIAKVKRPKAIFLENVKGLLSHDKGRTLDTMIKALADIDYAVDFHVLNSKHYQVPQNRERVFFIACPKEIVNLEPWKVAKLDHLGRTKVRNMESEGTLTFNFPFPENDTVDCTLMDILEETVDPKYYMSAEKTAVLVKQLKEKGNDSADLADLTAPNMVGHIDISGHNICKRVYNPNAQAPTLKASTGGNLQPKIFEEVWSEPRINILGNIKPPEATRNGQRDDVYSTNGLMCAICSTDYKQPRPVFGEITDYRIRKLTPKECWRLQGFSDADFQKVKDAGLSDTQLYKQAGNAVTVTVIKAIAERLVEFLANSKTEEIRFLSDDERQGMLDTLCVLGTKSEEYYSKCSDTALDLEYKKLIG